MTATSTSSLNTEDDPPRPMPPAAWRSAVCTSTTADSGPSTTSRSTVPEGRFYALLGPSGCGKTTTLRMVAGLEEPTAGQILIGGQDIAHKRPYQRPVNTVFQSYALFPHMTIFENVAFGLRRRKESDIDRAGQRDARAGRDATSRQAETDPALRRSAAADRGGPGAGQQAQGAAARRAAGRTGSQAAPADAARAEADPDRGRDHLHPRHP